jgi:hypothetical protein
VSTKADAREQTHTQGDQSRTTRNSRLQAGGHRLVVVPDGVVRNVQCPRWTATNSRLAARRWHRWPQDGTGRPHQAVAAAGSDIRGCGSGYWIYTGHVGWQPVDMDMDMVGDGDGHIYIHATGHIAHI